MRVLLDTHVWLWWRAEPRRLRDDVRALLTDRSNEVRFSAISGLEIGIKYALGKLDLPEPPATLIPPRLRADSIQVLPVRLEHTLRSTALPLHHRDPFDRVLVAQAQLEGLTLLTADNWIQSYDVDWMPA